MIVMEEKVKEILGMESEELSLEEEALRAAPVEPTTEKKMKTALKRRWQPLLTSSLLWASL